ncbi:MAG: ABC transporter substrate-binding protein [Prevotella sp.]|nr:ABC transporter substrate-binding protein [Prevotella sp.]
MNRQLSNFCFAILALLLTAMLTCCTVTTAYDNGGGDGIAMRYAQLLTLTQHDGYIRAKILDPWDSTRTLHEYVLVERSAPLPVHLPKGDVIRTPVTKAAVYTSVHCALLDELGAYGSIKGVCDLRYINMPRLQNDVARGRIIDLGESMTPNIEGIISMQPDAILLSPFENGGTYGKVGKMGIPLIECADYMETSPLGRAEWMRFYGLLFGCSERADSLFAAIEGRYNDLKSLTADAASRPTVVTEMKIGSTWYVAGGQSTVGILIRDAGGHYVFDDVNATGALPYSPEAVYDKAKDADCWLLKYNQATDMTLADLKQQWALNSRMKAFQRGTVYACNLLKTRFYEETPFHPDVILKEFASILHPDMVKNDNRFYKKLHE